MTVKIEVKNCSIYSTRKVIYTDNCVTKELVETVRELLDNSRDVRVSFDVMGATLHDILSHQLKEQLPDNYKVEISRYTCIVSKGDN